MRNRRIGWIVICFLAAIAGCRTPSSDWSGTWRVNPSKSNLRGPVFAVSVSPSGDYRYADGNTSFTFRCDGKDWPMGNSRTQTCVLSSATVLDLTRKENGIKTNTYHWELSPNETIFTSVVTAFRKNIPVVLGQLVATRVSGTNGFAGQWRDETYRQSHMDMILRIDSKALHVTYPGASEHIDAMLDGTEAPVNGPRSLLGVTYSLKATGGHRFLIQTKRDGKILTQGSLELKNDGRSITNSWWPPDRPADKSTLTYEKQ